MQHAALLKACESNDLEAVRRLLRRDADPTWVMPDGYSYPHDPGPAVLLAASRGQVELLQLLLAQRPDLTKTHGCTLLDKAIEGLADKVDPTERERYLRIIELIIERKVDVDRPDLGGFTPLMVATRFGQPEVVRMLIAAGANIKHANSRGDTALSLARSPAKPRPAHKQIVILLERALLGQ